jgi:hypothetical protein
MTKNYKEALALDHLLYTLAIRNMELEPPGDELGTRTVRKDIVIGIDDLLVLFLVLDLDVVLNILEHDLDDAVCVVHPLGGDGREDAVHESSSLRGVVLLYRQSVSF